MDRNYKTIYYIGSAASAIRNINDAFVPVSKYVKSNFPTGLTNNFRPIVVAKIREHALLKSSNNPHHYAQFSNIQGNYKFEFKKCLGSFWKFVCRVLPNNYNLGIVAVESGLDKLKNEKSARLDGLPGTYLFNLKSFLSVPLWLIFRR